MTIQEKNGLKLALVTMIFSGIANFANGYVVKGIDPLVLNVAKNGLVGVAILSLITILRKWPLVKLVSSRDWIKLTAIAVVGGSVPFWIYFIGLKQIGAVEASLIHKTLVFWVAAGGMLMLKEKLTLKLSLGIGLLYLANFATGFTGFKTFGLMHLLVLAATIMWAAENIIAKKILASVDSDIVTAARMGGGSLVLFGILASQGKVGLLTNLSIKQWGLIAIVAVLLFGYVTSWYRALKAAPATYVSSVLVGATLITSSLQAILVNHNFTPALLIQSLLIITGIMLVTTNRWTKNSSESKALALGE